MASSWPPPTFTVHLCICHSAASAGPQDLHSIAPPPVWVPSSEPHDWWEYTCQGHTGQRWVTSHAATSHPRHQHRLRKHSLSGTGPGVHGPQVQEGNSGPSLNL